VAIWQGDGRTATVKAIEERCMQNGITNTLEKVKEKAKDGVTTLLTAFYFHDAGIQGIERTFEFTHKSFGEFFAARKIVGQLIQTVKATQQHKEDQTGWSHEAALEKWIVMCGNTPIDGYIYNFLVNEVRRYDKQEVKCWQDMLCDFIGYILQNGMPYDKISHINFHEKLRHSRNSEEVLLAALSACAKYTGDVSKIKWPNVNAAGEWIAKLCGQGYGATQYLNHLDFSNCKLRGVFLYGANLEYSCLNGCSLDYSVMAYSNLYCAKLENTLFYRSDLSGANLNGVHFDNKEPVFFETKLNDVESGDAWVYAARGRYYHRDENYLKAVKDYSKAIELDPDNAEYHNSRGITYQWMKEYKKAIEDTSKAIELDPDNTSYYVRKAFSLHMAGKTNLALEQLKIAYELGVNDELYYRTLGIIRLKVAKKSCVSCDSELLDLFTQAVGLSKLSDSTFEKSITYMRRAEYYLYVGELDKALPDLNQSIDFNEQNEYAWYYLSKYYELVGDISESERCLRKAEEQGYIPEDGD